MTTTTPSYYNHPVLGETSKYVAHMPYFQGAAFKYLVRAGKKPGEPMVKDLKKAIDCLDIIKKGNSPLVIQSDPNLERKLFENLHAVVDKGVESIIAIALIEIYNGRCSTNVMMNIVLAIKLLEAAESD